MNYEIPTFKERNISNLIEPGLYPFTIIDCTEGITTGGKNPGAIKYSIKFQIFLPDGNNRILKSNINAAYERIYKKFREYYLLKQNDPKDKYFSAEKLLGINGFVNIIAKPHFNEELADKGEFCNVIDDFIDPKTYTPSAEHKVTQAPIIKKEVVVEDVPF